MLLIPILRALFYRERDPFPPPTPLHYCDHCGKPAKFFCKLHTHYVCEGCVSLEQEIAEMIDGPLPRCEYVSIEAMRREAGANV
jgi:hypothetical protein